MHAWSEQKSDSGKLYHVETLMGKREDPLFTIYARQLIERLSSYTSRHLLLSIALKEDGRDVETFQAIINSIFSNLSWLL